MARDGSSRNRGFAWKESTSHLYSREVEWRIKEEEGLQVAQGRSMV